MPTGLWQYVGPLIEIAYKVCAKQNHNENKVKPIIKKTPQIVFENINAILNNQRVKEKWLPWS